MTKDMLSLRESAELIYVDHSSRKDQWHSILHSHPFTELFYVIQGSGEMKFNNTEIFPIKEDDLIIVNPNVWHTEMCNDDDFLEYIVIGVDGVVFDSEQDPRFSFQNFTDYKHEILLYLKAMTNESSNKEPYHEEITSTLFQVLLMNILRRSTAQLELASTSTASNKDCSFLETYIYENSHLDITLDHLAEISFLDKFYLSHLFKKNFGMAPIEYQLKVRLDKSKKLLTTSNFSVSQISAMCGFSNPTYFSQFFKNKTSVSPSLYRQQNPIQSTEET